MNKKIRISIIAAFVFAVSIPQFVFAVAMYNPGETLNPACAPNTVDCTVNINPTVVASPAVFSVNGKIGVVALTTDDISEGTLNKYLNNENVRNLFSALTPLYYDPTTGIFSLIKDAILKLLPTIDDTTRGQFLTNDGLNVSWADISTTQTPSPVLDIPIRQIVSVVDIVTRETKYLTGLTDMSLTPGAGDYLVTFSTSVSSDIAGSIINISLFKNGIKIPSSEIFYSGIAKGFGSMYTTAYISNLLQEDIIDIRWKVSAGSGTMKNRTFIATQVK